MFKPSMAELGLCMYQVGIDNLTTAVTIFFSIAFIIVSITIVTFISISIQSILSSIASPRPTINTLVQEHPLTAKGTPLKTPTSHLSMTSLQTPQVIISTHLIISNHNIS